MARSLSEIARDIRRTWRKDVSGTDVWFGARPYLNAMSTMSSVHSDYGMDSGRSIVLYFLSNAATWRGEDARRIKKELKELLK